VVFPAFHTGLRITMKKLSLSLIIIFTFCFHLFSQNQYEISREQNGTKILKGIISRDLLSRDTAFPWYAENLKGYVPNAAAVTALKKNNQSIEFVAFGGTWCGDTKNIFPKFFNLLDTAGFTQERVTVIGVDRNKKTLSHLAEAFNITNVPTLIVMKDGKEVGRVVEYGKYGMFDKELAEIINSIAIFKPASATQ